MNKFKNELKWVSADVGEKFLIVLVIFLVIGIALAISYFAFAGIFYLICLCFEQLTFSWKLSTGIWLILIVLSSVFKTTVKSNNN